MKLTDQEIDILQNEYPEGIPVWIANQATSLDDARNSMNLRRRMQAKFAK